MTEHVKTMRSVPLRLLDGKQRAPRLPAVRGGAIMRVADFRALNEGLARQHQPLFANPRNAAAGSIRQLDPRVTASRRLDVFFYDILRVDGGPRLTDGMSVLRALADWGLVTSPHARLGATLDDAFAFHREMEQRRDRLLYEIDGIVLKLNDLAARARLRTTGRHPRWALALQVHAPRGRDGHRRHRRASRADWRVDARGPVAPRADRRGHGRPCHASQRRRDRAQGPSHRQHRPRRSRRRRDSRRRRAPPASRREAKSAVCDAAALSRMPYAHRSGRSTDRCPNGLACPAQLRCAIAHFGSREAMDILGLGPETVDALVSSGLVHSVADLFSLRTGDLVKLERFADVSAGTSGASDRHGTPHDAVALPERPGHSARRRANRRRPCRAFRQPGRDSRRQRSRDQGRTGHQSGRGTGRRRLLPTGSESPRHRSVPGPRRRGGAPNAGNAGRWLER